MINVNFFQKEKKNMLPTIVLLVFAVILIGMGLFFYLSREHYEDTIAAQTDWMAANAEEVVLSRQMDRLNQHTNESQVVQEDLRTRQFPMNVLSENIISFIPNENNRVNSFQLSRESSQVSLILENTSTTEAQNIVEDLEDQPYVERVQLLRAEGQGEGDNQIRYEMIINLNMEELNFDKEETE